MKASNRAKALFGILAVAASARLVDAALVAAGFATAAGTVVFAGAMLMRGDHAPDVNGMEYLAIFGRPRGSSSQPVEAPQGPASDVAVAAADSSPTDAAAPGSAGIDPTSVGSIGAGAPTDGTRFSLVAAQIGFAWVREGARIFAVRPGDSVPRLGRISAILQREGRWTVVGDNGAALLASGDPLPATDARAPFAREMIFGPGK